MTQQGKPEFNDAFATTKYTRHNKFDGRVVEILYGAKDAEGNPCTPVKDAQDGHGRWYGIETEGVYQMFSWQKPASEGGAIEYGTTYGDNALETMETQLDQKRELVREAEILADTSESADSKTRLEEIRSQLTAMPDWHTPKDREYLERLEKAEKKYEERISVLKVVQEDKEKIVQQAEALRNEPSFKTAKSELRRLKGQLADADSAGEKTDEALWQRFHAVEDEIKAKEDEYFANLDQHRAEAKSAKEQIIEETKTLTANVANWKEAGEKLNKEFDKWKAAGSAGHDMDEELWGQFNALRQKFYEGRQKFFDERNAKWAASIEAKENLIKEANAIAAEGNFDKAHTDRMKQLDQEWRKAGFSGKEKNDILWEEYNKAKDIFWGGKREQARKRTEEQLEASTEKLDAAKKQLADLEYRKTLDTTPALQEGIERNIYMKQNIIQDLEKEVSELQNRLDKSAEKEAAAAKAKELTKSAKTAAGNAAETLSKTADAVADKAKDAIKDAGEAAGDAAESLSKTADTVVDKAKDVLQDASEAVGPMVDGAREAAGDAAESLSKTADVVTDKAKDVLQDASEAVGPMVDGAKEAAGDAADAVKDLAREAVDAAQDGAESLSKAAAPVVDAVQDAAGDAADAMKKAAENLKDAVEDLTDGDDNKKDSE